MIQLAISRSREFEALVRRLVLCAFEAGAEKDDAQSRLARDELLATAAEVEAFTTPPEAEAGEDAA